VFEAHDMPLSQRTLAAVFDLEQIASEFANALATVEVAL